MKVEVEAVAWHVSRQSCMNKILDSCRSVRERLCLHVLMRKPSLVHGESGLES